MPKSKRSGFDPSVEHSLVNCEPEAEEGVASEYCHVEVDPYVKPEPGVSLNPTQPFPFIIVSTRSNALTPVEGLVGTDSASSSDAFGDDGNGNIDGEAMLPIPVRRTNKHRARPALKVTITDKPFGEPNSGPFIDCIYCKTRIYGTEPGLKQHKKDHVKAKERPHKCLLCEKTWLTKGHLNDHLIRAHTERAYECDVCHRRYKHQCDLNRHKERHSTSRPFQCSVCGAAFKGKGALYSHRYVHVSDQVYTCSICGATFSRPDSWARHEKFHAGEKRFQCSHCPKRFFSGTAVKEHEVVHSDEKTFICVVCSTAYKTARRLRDHVKISHGNLDNNNMAGNSQPNQSYEIASLSFEFEPNTTSTTEEVDPLAGLCPAPESDSILESCDVDIVSEDAEGGVSAANCEIDNSTTNFSIRAHLFGIPHSESIINYKFQCLSCPLKFPSKHKLTVHNNLAHARTGSASAFECKVCGRVFSRQKHYTVHMRQHTGNYVICDLCGKEFAHRQSLKKHVLASHGKTAWEEYQDTNRTLGRNVLDKEVTCASNYRGDGDDVQTSHGIEVHNNSQSASISSTLLKPSPFRYETEATDGELMEVDSRIIQSLYR